MNNAPSQMTLPTSTSDNGLGAIPVSEFLNLVNQTLDYAYSSAVVVGEVSSFKVNQGKWVFFDLKDDDSSIGCFLPLWELRAEIQDGMKVAVRGFPKVTKWGKFSFTVRQIQPVGEGSIKKSFELLKKKLSAEGLFAPEKKRPLPPDLQRIGVISSTQAAGYADFIKIINERWGGLEIQVAHTGVQGLQAADQIIRALKYLNERQEVQVIAIIRGGGSADDLAVFNDEQLVRAIAASRIPVITGIGHEVDESLSDLAADLRGSTPSNVAQMLTPDRQAVAAHLSSIVSRLRPYLMDRVSSAMVATDFSAISNTLAERLQAAISQTSTLMERAHSGICSQLDRTIADVAAQVKIIHHLNPDNVLKRGYAILSGKIAVGETVAISTIDQEATAKIIQVKERKI